LLEDGSKQPKHAAIEERFLVTFLEEKFTQFQSEMKLIMETSKKECGLERNIAFLKKMFSPFLT
jgi:hypothetical protein